MSEQSVWLCNSALIILMQETGSNKQFAKVLETGEAGLSLAAATGPDRL